MFKKTKLLALIFTAAILTFSCSSDDDNDAPKYLDNIIGSWRPFTGLLTGEIIDGEYGEPSFKYNFSECSEEKAFITFKNDGSFEFEKYRGKLSEGCSLRESSKNITWESVGDSTYIAEGTINQFNNQGTYDEKDIFESVYEPVFFDQPDLVEVKNDTLILYFDKIPKTNLYDTRFFYVKIN